MGDCAPDILFKASAVPTAVNHVYADVLRSAKSIDGEVEIVADPFNGLIKCGVQWLLIRSRLLHRKGRPWPSFSVFCRMPGQ